MENEINIIHNIITEENKSRANKIKKIITEKETNPRNEFNYIKTYLDSFLNGNPTNRFIVMPGLRGTGKTTLLFQFYEYLLSKEEIEPNQILYISGDEINDIIEFNVLETIKYYVKEFHNSSLLELDKKLFIFIDEAQYDANWSLRGKIIFDKTENIFMIFMGSSALDFEINVDSARRLLKFPIYPLKYNEYLSLKYNIELRKTKPLKDMIFSGNIENAKECEVKINSKIINSQKIKTNEWIDYLKNGGFPDSFTGLTEETIELKFNEMVERIILKDLRLFKNMTTSTNTVTSRLISYLSLQKPGEVSKNKLASNLGCSSGIIQELLYILEKSHLIFPVQPLGSSSKRIRKPWKYYFATSSIKHNLAKKYGIGQTDINAYYGILSENLVASSLKTIARTGILDLYYDSDKGGVDFLIQTKTFDTIPIEVGYGKKSKKQITKAINKYNSTHGIIVSNTTPTIEKEDNVLYMPLETFSFI